MLGYKRFFPLVAGILFVALACSAPVAVTQAVPPPTLTEPAAVVPTETPAEPPVPPAPTLAPPQGAPIAHLAAGQAIQITWIRMLDGSQGWAIGGLSGSSDHVLRTSDGGQTWKDLETGVSSSLFAVAAVSRNDLLIVGEQGKILHSKDAGETWELQPSVTNTSLFAIAYRGGTNIWIAGRGGAILRRVDPIATVNLPAVTKLPPILRGSAKADNVEQFIDEKDIPKAVPPKKPVRP